MPARLQSLIGPQCKRSSSPKWRIRWKHCEDRASSANALREGQISGCRQRSLLKGNNLALRPYLCREAERGPKVAFCTHRVRFLTINLKQRWCHIQAQATLSPSSMPFKHANSRENTRIHAKIRELSNSACQLTRGSSGPSRPPSCECCSWCS